MRNLILLALVIGASTVKSDEWVWHVEGASLDSNPFDSNGRIGVRFGVNIGFGF